MVRKLRRRNKRHTTASRNAALPFKQVGGHGLVAEKVERGSVATPKLSLRNFSPVIYPPRAAHPRQQHQPEQVTQGELGEFHGAGSDLF